MSRCKDKIGEVCQNKECRQWIDYSEDDNLACCCKEERQNDAERCAKRLGVSYVRVKQIEDKAEKTRKKAPFFIVITGGGNVIQRSIQSETVKTHIMFRSQLMTKKS